MKTTPLTAFAKPRVIIIIVLLGALALLAQAADNDKVKEQKEVRSVAHKTL